MILRTIRRGALALALALGQLGALSVALVPAIALAQRAPVYQTGTMLSGNIAKFSTNGLIQDASGILGDINGKGVNPFAITDSLGTGLCANSGVTGSAYYSLCLGHDSSGNALLDVEANGGTSKGLNFKLNGTVYPFPFAVGGIVGPGSTTAGHLALWNNTGGTLLADAGLMLIPVTAYGAVSGSDSTIAIQNAINAGCAGGFGIYVPDGDWKLSSQITIGSTCAHFRLIGQSANAHLDYIGSATITAPVLVNGAIWYFVLDNLTITGNAHTTYALQSNNAHHGIFSNLRLRDATTSGYAGSFGVSNEYRNISCSNNEGAFAVQPASCFKSVGDGTTNCNGGPCGLYDGTVINLTAEGLSGDGISLDDSNDMTFVGGTSEGNTGRGANLTANTLRDTFLGVDFESNSTQDVLDNGQFNQYTNIVSCCTGRFEIGAAAQGTRITGGTFDNLTVDAGAGSTYALFVHPGYISNSYSFGGGSSVWDFSGTYTAYTPVVAANSGGISAYTAAGRWRVTDKTVHLVAGILISNNGTGAGNLTMSLPFTPTSLGSPAVNGTCTATDETAQKALATVMNGTTTMTMTLYDGTYPGVTNHKYDIDCTYERLTAGIVN